MILKHITHITSRMLGVSVFATPVMYCVFSGCSIFISGTVDSILLHTIFMNSVSISDINIS